MWRVGVLYRVQDLLATVAEDQPDERGLHESLRFFRGVRFSVVMEACHMAGWLTSGLDGRLSLSARGRRMISLPDAVLRLREQVATLMDVLRPPWGPAILQGRQAFVRYVPPEALQCFREAGLLDGSAPDVVSWWDKRAAVYRAARDADLMEIGREGERLSVEHERLRTGHDPRWIALEYTDAGYDVLSRVSSDEVASLAVEVKATSRSWDSAVFYLTRHEWDVLAAQPSAVLHLWCIASRAPMFALLPIPQLAAHVPKDTGEARWQVLACPFSICTPLCR